MQTIPGPRMIRDDVVGPVGIDPNIHVRLEEFLRAMQQTDDPREQLRLCVRSMQACTAADAVLWFPGTSREDGELAANRPLSIGWANEVGTILARQVGDRENRWLCNDGAALPAGLPSPAPQAVAMICLSHSRSAWLIAVNLSSERPFSRKHLELFSLHRQILQAHRRHLQVYQNLKNTLFGLIQGFTTAIDAKDPYTCGHSERVARIAVRIAQEMGLPNDFLSDIYLAGLLHDIGKIGIPDKILQKPGKLTEEEFAIIRSHPGIGEQILANIADLRRVRPGVRSHHERVDGSGYPDRLRGEEIPLLARVLAVADAFDAMLSARPYRAALPPELIESTMKSGAGGQWDAEAVRHLISCRDELYPICQKGIGESVFRAVSQTVAGLSEPESLLPRP